MNTAEMIKAILEKAAPFFAGCFVSGLGIGMAVMCGRLAYQLFSASLK